MLGFDIAYLYTKFDVCSFSRSRDMVSAHQNLNGLWPGNATFKYGCYPWASTCYLSTKFYVYLHPLQRYERRYL